MSIITFHEKLNYRTTDKILRHTALTEWRKYTITAAPRNPLCTIIRVDDNFILYLYDNIKDWRMKIRKSETNTNTISNFHTTVYEGNRCASSPSIIIFLWSLFSNLDSRNAAEFNEREHNLYRQLGRFFYLRNNEYSLIIDDWKANVKN